MTVVDGANGVSECNIMLYKNSCNVQYLNVTKWELIFRYETCFINSTCTVFIITHALQGHYTGIVV